MEGVIERFDLGAGYEISRIIKGGWQLSEGHSESVSPDPVGDMLAFIRHGIDTFDCADIYTGVESLIGEFLDRNRSGAHPAPVRVHTKYVPDLGELPGIARTHTERIVDRSLRRLRVERLDMVQFHWWDTKIPGYVETAGWLRELQQAGKIDRLSLTNFNTRVTREILGAGIPLTSTQVQYSLLDTRPEKGLAELCARNGMHLLCYGTLAGGFLSDRWLGAMDPQVDSATLENRSLTKYRLIIEEIGGWALFQSLLETLAAIGRRHGVSIASVASRWVLEQPRVAGVIIGARDTKHLDRYAELFRFCLSERDRREIDALRSQMTVPPGDVFDLERDRLGRHGRIMKYDLNAEH
jgi:aryl-alcohol dehydrogenase-like predicted oxidoreductase